IESCSMRQSSALIPLWRGRSVRSLMAGKVPRGAPIAPIGGPPLGFRPIVNTNTRRLSSRPRLRWLGALVLTLVVPILVSGPAAADPIAAKKAQAAQLARQI